MIVLGLDTATPATVAGVLRGDGSVCEARHDPAPGERPGHATLLLGLVDDVLARAGVGLGEVERIAAGVGPGSFTGLRIGIATARGLAQGTGAPLVGVSTLRALALGAPAPARPVVAVVDARRGEVFAAAWTGHTELMAPAALAPDDLGRALRALPGTPLAIGDGALRFREDLEPAGAEIPPDDDPLHRVAARPLCRLGAAAEPAGIDAVVPDYHRLPDAEARVRRP